MKKKALWAIFTLCLSLLTIYGLFHNSGLSISELITNIKESSPLWLIPAALCMLGFIFFEGRSLVLILRTLGYPAKKRRGFLYASADIYFSSITPSATGGQHASAYFMYKDGVTAIEVTVSLILNVVMYNLALVTLGLLTLFIFPGIFRDFNLASKIMILIGITVLLLLITFFIVLLKHQKLIHKFVKIIISILNKFHIKSFAEKLQTKIDNTIENYNECVVTLAGKKKLLVKTYLLNLLQRTSQILVTVFCYFAMHGSLSGGLKTFAIQTYVVLGSNFIPIPGAVGISEFIMFFGYTMLMNEEAAYSLAILSLGISFYTCIIISIITVLIGYILIFYKQKKQEEKI